MSFPLELPVKPMLAKLSRTIPDGDGWLYEPKWDGFRCIVAREADPSTSPVVASARSPATSPSSCNRSATRSPTTS